MQTYCFTEKQARIRVKLEKLGQEVIYSSECFNSQYMEFVGYDTREQLIWTPGEGSVIKNKTSKQGITKSFINKISTSILGFGCSPHKDTCDILSEYLVSYIF